MAVTRFRLASENQSPQGSAEATDADLTRYHDVREPSQLFAIIDGQRQAVPFNEITDEPRRLQFKQRCQQAAAPVVLNVIDFFTWPDAVRFLLLKLVKQLGDWARVRIGDDQEQYTNAFEAIVAAISAAVGTEQPTAAKQAAIEAAALFLVQDAWPAAANTIADGLAEIGTQNVTALEVFNVIRNVAGIVIDPKRLDLGDLASHFHGCLQLEIRAEAGEPVLRYFRDEFYSWNGRTWQRVDDKELKARVTRHM